MRLFFVQSRELIKSNPKIDSFNLKADGIYIGVPGMIIFRSRDEAQAAIDAAHKAIEMNGGKE